MRVRLLGTAAGGGLPQWNCNCRNCRGVRSGALQVLTRTQSSVAISADDRRWFLLNASPDVRIQIESFPSLLPALDRVRGTSLEGVLLTNADLDHVLGLFILREGSRLRVYASASVKQALSQGLKLDSVLEHYCGVSWCEPPLKISPLLGADGNASGVLYCAVPVRGKLPRYLQEGASPAVGNVVAYRFVDESTGGRLLFMPDVAALDDRTLDEMRNCDALLIDGTFWSENEMLEMGVGGDSASEMGHVPVSGATGSLASIASLPIPHKIYIHINNTNPMLIEHSVERATVEAAGVQIGWDGMELVL
jgi:pyrroloquinoline quinone biosynthesis protein B